MIKVFLMIIALIMPTIAFGTMDTKALVEILQSKNFEIDYVFFKTKNSTPAKFYLATNKKTNISVWRFKDLQWVPVHNVGKTVGKTFSDVAINDSTITFGASTLDPSASQVLQDAAKELGNESLELTHYFWLVPKDGKKYAFLITHKKTQNNDHSIYYFTPEKSWQPVYNAGEFGDYAGVGKTMKSIGFDPTTKKVDAKTISDTYTFIKNPKKSNKATTNKTDKTNKEQKEQNTTDASGGSIDSFWSDKTIQSKLKSSADHIHDMNGFMLFGSKDNLPVFNNALAVFSGLFDANGDGKIDDDKTALHRSMAKHSAFVSASYMYMNDFNILGSNDIYASQYSLEYDTFDKNYKGQFSKWSCNNETSSNPKSISCKPQNHNDIWGSAVKAMIAAYDKTGKLDLSATGNVPKIMLEDIKAGRYDVGLFAYDTLTKIPSRTIESRIAGGVGNTYGSDYNIDPKAQAQMVQTQRKEVIYKWLYQVWAANNAKQLTTLTPNQNKAIEILKATKMPMTLNASDKTLGKNLQTQKQTATTDTDTQNNKTTSTGRYNKEKSTIIDTTMKVQWQDHAPLQKANYADAKKACNALDLGGHQDWQLPEFMEIMELVNVATEAPFDHKPGGRLWMGQGQYTQVLKGKQKSADISATIVNMVKETDESSVQSYICMRKI